MHLIRLLVFIIKAKVSILFGSKVDILKNTAYLLLITTFAVLNGKGLALSISYTHVGRIDINPQKILNFIAIGIFAFTIIKDFIPSYQPKKSIIPMFYPIKIFKRCFCLFINELVTPFYIGLSAFILSFHLSSKYIDYNYSISLFFLVFSATLILLTLKTVVEHKVKFKPLHVLNIAICLAFAILYKSLNISLINTAIIMFFYSSIAFYLVESSIVEIKSLVNYDWGKKWMSIALNNEQMRTIQIFSIVLKIGTFIFYGMIDYKYADEPAENIEYFILSTFIHPYVVSYALNNTFGFYRNMWLIVDRIQPKKMFWTYTQIAIPWYAIDLVLTSISFIFISLPWEVIVSYYFTSIILFSLGFVPSIYFPKFISRIFFNSNSSYLFGTATFLICYITILPVVNHLFFIIYPILILAVFTSLRYTIKDYPNQVHKIYLSLFKTN